MTTAEGCQKRHMVKWTGRQSRQWVTGSDLWPTKTYKNWPM